MKGYKNIRKYINNKKKINERNKLPKKVKSKYNPKSRIKDENKKLLNKSHHRKISKNYMFLKNIFSPKNYQILYDNNFFSNEFSYKFKAFLIFFLIFTFAFLSIFFEINSENNEIENNFGNINEFIKVGYYCDTIKYGGVQRVMALLLNYLSKEKYFINYLITNSEILEDEYPVPDNIRRISLSQNKIDIYQALEIEHIDILIYNFYEFEDIKKLSQLKNTKVIFYDHSSFLIWVYQKIYAFGNSVYHVYQNCSYVISLIPLENDYLFKNWGINSILMDNPTTFEYDSVIPSDLSNKNIIMMGRAEDEMKRYDLGINAMKTILKEIPESQMDIVSEKNDKLENLIKNLELEEKVKFIGFQTNIEKYLKNASLHIMPSLCETYPMVLSEAKIFGLPTIICGLDYLALAKGGTVIIYDDNPETIAKEAIKILKDDEYRKKLGKEARESMKKHKNDEIRKKWVKLLLSVYKGDLKSYQKLNDHNKMTEEEADGILNKQLNLLKLRIRRLRRVTLEKMKSFSFYK